MKSLLIYAGAIAGFLGALLCAISGIMRVMGGYYVAGYELTTFFTLGTGLMVFACLVKLELLLQAQQQQQAELDAPI